MLLHVPAAQHLIASEAAEILSERLKTKVSVGTVNMGLLNRAIIDDIAIEDQQHRKMLLCHRLSAKVDILPLLNGRIAISSAQIFGLRAQLIKPSATEPLNCQFVIDALSSKDTTSHTPLDLYISSLVIRNTSVSYDRQDMPRKPYGFDANHININKLSTHLMLYTLTDDSLSVRLKRLSFAELNSNFAITDMSFDVNAGKHSARIRDFNLITDNSDVSIDASLAYSGSTINSFSLQSKHSSIGLRDIAAFVPSLSKVTNTLFLDADVTGNDKSCSINNLSLRSSDRSLDLSLSAKASSALPLKEAVKQLRALRWDADLRRLHIAPSFAGEVITALGSSTDMIGRIGAIDYVAQANGREGDVNIKGLLSTGVGELSHQISLAGNHLTAKLNSSTMHLGQLLDTDVIGDTQLDADISADITLSPDIQPHNLKASIVTPLLTVGNYPYRNTKLEVQQSNDDITANIDIKDINVNALINASASNISALLAGDAKALRNISLNADISSFNPNALGLTTNWVSTIFGLNLKATVAGIGNPFERIVADISDISMIAPDKRYICNNISIEANESENGNKNINLTSDFADIHASGRFSPATLHQSLVNLVSKRLPTLPGLSAYKPQDNDMTLSATIRNTEILQKVLGIDVDVKEQIDINAHINDALHIANINIDAPSLSCYGNELIGTSISTHCQDDTLALNLLTSKLNKKGVPLHVSLKGKAANNNLSTAINWQNGKGNDFRGSLNADSQFFLSDTGSPIANISIQPSEVIITDTVWNLHPSSISYTDNRLTVKDFLLENGRQHLSINGKATRSSNDSLMVNLHDINVGYIMNLVNFHSVEFEGFATGSAVAKALFSEPDAYADLDVANFYFENGRLGTLTVHAHWDNPKGQIDIDAQCADPDVVDTSIAPGNKATDGFIKIDGYVGLKQEEIFLDIQATNARLEFINTYTSSFMNDINVWASGHVKVLGPLSAINLIGEAHATGSVYINPLNTTYSLRNAYVRMVHNEIIFENDTIYDRNGNTAVASGALHHKDLKKMTFDLDIDAKSLLFFDFPTLNGSTFCGHVVGSGNCKLKGRPGVVTLDINVNPEETSFIEYNASSPDALQNQEFITWRSADSIMTNNAGTGMEASATINTPEKSAATSTDIHLNILIHATPKASLRLLMDQRTGDYITLNGNGTLHAHYYNKGGLEIFGNYIVERGDYKMTIQHVISKNFEFLKGGTLAFGGNPMLANIDLKAQYVVPSASLADLNIGNSFKNTTVRVNCLMNITGTPEKPVIDFDFNIPQASPDIQQMITSLMDSEEARNQQVVYLLAIGRFYNATNTIEGGMQSQASLAMQSFLSGTVSQQLNNLISNTIIKNNNWNFGANISPGDEGMMNAEYEGLISGRMLNNRLLINGQFGYRDNVNATTSFIGDFDVRYLLFPNGNLQVKVYNQTSDRYFTKSSLNTQGIGIILNHDFKSFIPNFLRKKQKTKTNGKQ